MYQKAIKSFEREREIAESKIGSHPTIILRV
jgi:hypothetical protein